MSVVTNVPSGGDGDNVGGGACGGMGGGIGEISVPSSRFAVNLKLH